MVIDDRFLKMNQLSNIFEEYIDRNEVGSFAGRFGLSKQAPEEAKKAFEEWEKLLEEQKRDDTNSPFDF